MDGGFTEPATHVRIVLHSRAPWCTNPVMEVVVSELTVAFDRFWPWLKEHCNCILEASTAECTLFDHEDLHWHIGEDPEGRPLVQLIRGKALYVELVLETRSAAMVRGSLEEGADPPRFRFEINGVGDLPAYVFVMAHGMDDAGPGRHTPSLPH